MESVQRNLWLIDLARSERQDKIGAQGERLKESNFINKSLSTLSDVVHTLTINSSHIPFKYLNSLLSIIFSMYCVSRAIIILCDLIC